MGSGAFCFSVQGSFESGRLVAAQTTICATDRCTSFGGPEGVDIP